MMKTKQLVVVPGLFSLMFMEGTAKMILSASLLHHAWRCQGRAATGYTMLRRIICVAHFTILSTHAVEHLGM